MIPQVFETLRREGATTQRESNGIESFVRSGSYAGADFLYQLSDRGNGTYAEMAIMQDKTSKVTVYVDPASRVVHEVRAELADHRPQEVKVVGQRLMEIDIGGEPSDQGLPTDRVYSMGVDAFNDVVELLKLDRTFPGADFRGKRYTKR